MPKRTDFYQSTAPEPHRIRTKEILKKHPQVRALIGKNPLTFLAILGLVGGQVTLAALVADRPWWVVIVAAYLLGAFFDHSLFVMIHECAHRLLFKSPAANRLAGMLANIPQLFPSSVSFERYHIKHHSFQGIHELDADLDVFVAFETMNNRGKQLSKLELLKNRLIYLSTLAPVGMDQQLSLRRNINDVWKSVYRYLGMEVNSPLPDDDFLAPDFVEAMIPKDICAMASTLTRQVWPDIPKAERKPPS